MKRMIPMICAVLLSAATFGVAEEVPPPVPAAETPSPSSPAVPGKHGAEPAGDTTAHASPPRPR